MHTYLFICGIIANGLVLLTIIGHIISKISERKINKQMAAEEAQKQIRYKEELKEAEKAWQVWAKKYDELRQSWDKETDRFKRMLRQVQCEQHKWVMYQFTSTSKSVCLFELGKENNWFYQKQ